MQINRDYYENLEIPDFVLCKANRERIGIIPCTDKTADFNFGDMDEITFKTYLMIDDEINPIYNSIEVMKYILVPNVGFYYIQSCNIQSEGSEHEYKEVTARSYEGLLGQKYLENFMINTGETGSKELEYDETGETQIYIWLPASEKVTGKMDLFDYVLEKCPDWYVAYVDPTLLEEGRSHRSFNIDRQDVYSFIMNDLQEAFECYVEYDTVHTDSKGRNGILIYAQENYKYDTDIYVSYDNLLKSTNISSDTDDIKTCVVLKGEDELEIREINFGYDRIYNFDYYNNTDFWSQKLYDEYNTWYTKTYTIGMIERSPNVYTEDLSDEELENMSYSDLYKLRLKAYLEAKKELDDLNNLTSEFVNDDDRTVGSGEFPVFDDDGNEVGSIKFETDTGVYICENLPATPPLVPYPNEESADTKNYIFIIKDAEVDITAIKNKLNIVTAGKNYTKTDNAPIPCMKLENIYKLQNKYITTVDAQRRFIIEQLRDLERGGNVDLVFRPIIDAKMLELAGWGKQESSYATIYTSTYSDEFSTIAMNFTPIVSDNKGGYTRILSPNELERYAENIIYNYRRNKVINDDYRIKVGQTYVGGSCIDRAVNDAIRIHELHEQYYSSGAYWPFFDRNTTFENGTYIKINNVNNLISEMRSEMERIEESMFYEMTKYKRNMDTHHEEDSVEYKNYNDATIRLKILDELFNKTIYYPVAPTYSIDSATAQNLISINSAYSNLLISGNRYTIKDINQYINQVNADENTQKHLLEVSVSTSTVTYPGYLIYRWFDNTDTREFYDALVRVNNQYDPEADEPTFAKSDAEILRKYNPLYNTVVIEESNIARVTDKEKFEEYLEEDTTEQTALITKFPTSTWFNTNDWRGYGYSELKDTWAMSVDQELTVMSKNNWGAVPSQYKDEEVDVAPFWCKARSGTIEPTDNNDDPYNYFGNYLPTYLTQLAIEAQIAALDAQIDGYDIYPYPLTSKGTVYFENLPTENINQGDTYTIQNSFVLNDVTYPANTNITWDGSKWVTTDSITTHVDGIQNKIDNNAKYKAQVVNEISLDNNLSEESRIELSAFIREEELSSDNYVITDVMTEEERQEMLQSFLEYGEKELSKICIPQLSFTADIADLFSIPEFDVVSEDFEPGKTIFVSIRDDYHVKATLLTLHINYYDPTDFTMTFSDVLKKSEGLYTDLQTAINTATDAATSVAIGSSSWSAGTATALKINQSLEDGLLSQGNYLSDNPAQSTFNITDTGIFVDTASGDYGKYDVFGEEKFVYDSIYIGGGRILFTDDGWKHVRMSLGRSIVTRMNPNDMENPIVDEEFGVYADFVISGYIAGSQICGSELFSSEYTEDEDNNKVPISYWDLDSGKISIYKDGVAEEPVFSFDGADLNLRGNINAIGGTIGGFTINSDSLTSNNIEISPTQLKYGSNFTVSSDGKLNAVNGTFSGNISSSAISGGTITGTTISGGSIRVPTTGTAKFSVASDGTLSATGATINGDITATSGKIAGWTISGNSLVSNSYIDPSTYAQYSLSLDGNSGILYFAGGSIRGYLLQGVGNLDISADHINLNGEVLGKINSAYLADQIKSSDGSYRVYINGTPGLIPSISEIINCGGGDHKWKTVYAKNGTINTSDKNKKNTIKSIDSVYEDLFFKINPVTYKFNDGDRIHIGAISQDIYASMQELGLSEIDFGGFCRDAKTKEIEDEDGNIKKIEITDKNGNIEYNYALRYQEFIMLNTHMIQKAYKRIEELEKEIERLKQ